MIENFIHSYSLDDQDVFDYQLQKAYQEYPYTIITILESYEKFATEKNYFRAFRRYIDFFEVSIQYCSSIILSILKHEKIPFDETLRQISAKIVEKELSTGDWFNSIFFVLLKKAIELTPDDPLVLSLNDSLNNPKGNILNGWSSKKEEEYKSIPYFRNTYLGHDSSLSETIYKDVISEIEPRIFVMLQAMAPLAKCTTFTVDKVVDDESEKKRYTILLLKGIKTAMTVRITTSTKLIDSKYYMVRRDLDGSIVNAKDILEVTPFVIYLPYIKNNEELKTTYLFQSVKSNNLRKMVYISPNIDAVRKETELFKDLFMTFLEETLGRNIIDKNYNIAISKGKTWEEYIEITINQTNRFLGQMKGVKKYDPSLYVERTIIRSAWNHFLEMPDRRAFVLLGNAGAGKTNLICNLAEQTIAKKAAVITYNSKIFSLVSLEDKLKEDFKESKLQGQQILEQLNKKATENNQQIIIFFDALNECIEYNNEKGSNGPVKLLQDIDKLLVKEELKAIKILITCRTYTWEEAIQSEQVILNLKCYFTTNDITKEEKMKAGENLSLKGFSEAEFREVYPKYQQAYDLRTNLNTLMEADYAFTRVRLEDPLVLSLSSQIYSGNHLPQNVQQFDSVKLFNARLEQLEKMPNGMQQVFLLEEFTRILRKQRTDGLKLKLLYQAFDDQVSEIHSLSTQMFQGNSYEWKIPMKTLLDSGILRVEKSTREHELRFTFERFHEFMYAKIFVAEESEYLSKRMPIPPDSFEREMREMKGYAVIYGALRHALVIDYGYTKGDPSTIITLANSSAYGASSLIMSTLSSLIIDNYSEICTIIHQLLEYKKENSEPLAEEIEEKQKMIEEANKGKNKLTKAQISALNQEVEILTTKLQPIIQVRKIAIQVIYEIFKSQVFSRNLYQGQLSPFILLWRAMADPVDKVRDNVSLYIYYISKYDVSIGIRILNHLSENIMDTSLFSLVKVSKRKEFQESYIEPAGRLSLLMVVEALVQNTDYERCNNIKGTWKSILKKLTLNFTLLKIVMPFLKFFLRRQATVQVAYVNNGIEYQHFWDTIPITGNHDEWTRDNFLKIVPLLDPDHPGIEQFQQAMAKGIETGDAFSYFLIERVMVSQGWKDWNRIRPLVMQVAQKPAGHTMLDYMQMSMLYVLFHSIEKSDEANEEAFTIFSKMTEEWSERCRGLLYAHRNQQANKGLPYKQYPLNWYGAAYCKHWGDGGIKPGDPYPLPVFRNLIDKAITRKDKELLYYCLENIATLVTDFSKPISAIQQFEYVINQIHHEKTISDFDAITTNREEHKKDLRTFLCSTIGTIKSYYPKEVANFIHNKLTNSQFPNMDRFREELMLYNQSHESIADLLTHKFGNFVIWGLLHDKAVNQFFIEGFKAGGEVNDYFEWFDGIVRLSFDKLFKINI